MIPSRAEVTAWLTGALHLARFDAAGTKAFGHTGADAGRSFFAAAVVAPMFLLWTLMHGFGTPASTPLPYALVYELLIYAGGWLVFPVVLWQIMPAVIGSRTGFAHFLCAYNWTAVIQNAMFLALDILLTSAHAPPAARGFFGFALLIYVILYGWFVARSTLGLAAGAAGLVVAVDMLTALAWEGFTDSLAGG